MYTWDILSREYRNSNDKSLERRLMKALHMGDQLSCVQETKLDRTLTCMDIDKSRQW